MSKFLEKVEDIQYTLKESGEVSKEDLVDFIESLDYDSSIELNLNVNGVEVSLTLSPDSEEQEFSLTINQEIIELPETIQDFRGVGEFLMNYLENL